MKRPARAALAAAIAVPLMFLLLCPLINNLGARAAADGLCRIPLPENTRRLDAVSAAGKLVGNGNGMQYFSAILLESSLSREELDAYYTPYRAGEWECVVDRQEGQEIRAVEHGTLAFSAPAGENCYIVYSWEDGIEPFSFFDLRGH